MGNKASKSKTKDTKPNRNEQTRSYLDLPSEARDKDKDLRLDLPPERAQSYLDLYNRRYTELSQERVRPTFSPSHRGNLIILDEDDSPFDHMTEHAMADDSEDSIEDGQEDYDLGMPPLFDLDEASYQADDDDDDDDDSDSDDSESTSSGHGSVTDEVCSTEIGGIKVSAVEGNIATFQVDVMVCSSAGSLNLDQGAIAQSISKQAGSGLQAECHRRYPDGIKAGQVVETGPANLSCKVVLHVCLPKCRGEQSRKVLRNAIYKCLSLASKSGHATMALPALGTGRLGYQRNAVARSVTSAVKSFHHRHPNSSLKRVICVIHSSDKQTVKAFSEHFKESTVDTSDRQEARVQFGNIAVKLTVGKLIEQKSDVIVGTCTRKMELSNGRLSKALSEAAGPSLQAECQTSYPQGVKHGEVAVLGSGNLGCSAVYLGALPRYDKPPADSERTPRECLDALMTKCLNQALKDKRSSLSFSPLGTGYLKFPPQTSAKIMLQAICNFSNKNRDVIMMIYVIVHPDQTSLQKTLKPFKSAFDALNMVPTSPSGAESVPERFTPDFCMYMYNQTHHRPPNYWSHFTSMKPIKDWKTDCKGKDGYKLTDVDAHTFQSVETLLMNTWEVNKVGHGRDAKNLAELGYTGIKIQKIQRLENLTLFENYCHRQAQLFHKVGGRGEMLGDLEEADFLDEGRPKTAALLDDNWHDRLYGEVNEGYFFHGTRPDRVQNLLKQGIDVRMAQGTSVYGQAIYMAESSTKADQYADHRDKRQKTGLTMFLVRASLGQICVMNHLKKMRRPPCLEKDCGSDDCSHDRYDSIVEEGKFIFREFVLYDTHQAYPEYVISYDRV